MYAQELVGGTAQGKLLFSDVGLSFWGGVNPSCGTVIDHTHPLKGESLAGKVVAIPNGRGSCTGSQVILELLLGENPPAALLLRQPDVIICLGVIVAEELFSKSIPILSLGTKDFDIIGKSNYSTVSINGPLVNGFTDDINESCIANKLMELKYSSADKLIANSTLELTEEEQYMLSGGQGEAVKIAMRILTRAAVIQGARNLMEISQAHIDGCTYIGSGGLRFAQKLADLGSKVRVPTTLNSISVDRRRWRALGVPEEFGEPATSLSEAYLSLGAQPSFTCAPYLLENVPKVGDQIAWGESNAVVYANSVLGARTQKYADYLDICAALTGRVPFAGAHLDDERKATIVLDARKLVSIVNEECRDALFPALGYLCGLKAGARVPVILGFEKYTSQIVSRPSTTFRNPNNHVITCDDLKAFSAAFGTTSGAPMFHMSGITPEVSIVENSLENIKTEEYIELTVEDLANVWIDLDNSDTVINNKKSNDVESSNSKNINTDKNTVELIAIGNPHLSLNECAWLASMCSNGESKHPDVSVVATLGREVFTLAEEAGYIKKLEKFGMEFITDTCWCMLTEPVVPPLSKTLMTNSAKFAHYGPALLQRQVRFGSMISCLSTARTGKAPPLPAWVKQHGYRGFYTTTNNTLQYNTFCSVRRLTLCFLSRGKRYFR